MAVVYEGSFKLGPRLPEEVLGRLVLICLHKHLRDRDRVSPDLLLASLTILASEILESEVRAEAEALGIEMDEEELREFLAVARLHKSRVDSAPVYLGTPLLELWSKVGEPDV